MLFKAALQLRRAKGSFIAHLPVAATATEAVREVRLCSSTQ
jgi:hypothetical protein